MSNKPTGKFLLTIIAAAVGFTVCVFLVRQPVPPDSSGALQTNQQETNQQETDPETAARLAANQLDKQKQKHIWKVEHATFELETHFGTAFRRALTERSEQALAGFLQDGLKAHLLPADRGQKRSIGPLSELYAPGWTPDADAVQPVPGDSAAVVDSLLTSIEILKTVERTRLRVLALDTTDGTHWTSEVLLECTGPDSSGQPTLISSRHLLELTFAADEDIQAGRIISGWHDRNRSRKTSRQNFLTEVTAQTGLSDLPLYDNWKLGSKLTSQYWTQLAVSDFNRDGYPDIAVGSLSGKALLLQSDHCRTFLGVTAQMQIRSWVPNPRRLCSLATWIDYNNDAWPDLLLGEKLYRNREGIAFEDVTRQSGLKFDHHAMGVAVADYDCDGLLDLYVLYQINPKPGTSTGPRPWVGDHDNGAQNQLWRNQGNGRFRNVTEQSGAGGGLRKSFAATWHFLDDDHFPDLYIANDFGQNVHLRNSGDGTFDDVSARTGTADFATTMGVCSGDLNNDGSPELYVANMFSKMGRRIIGHVGDSDYEPGIYEQILGSCAGNRLYSPTPGSTRFQEISESAGVNQVGWAYAPAMADFNADGLLDIYATTGFMSFDRKKPDG
ncbi:MAG: FG-GAP-like repeat-containing protein [Planctomycetaceae bacterium]